MRIRKVDQGPVGLPEKLPEKHAKNLDSKQLFVLPRHVQTDLTPTSFDPTFMLLGRQCPESVLARVYVVLSRDIFRA